MAKAIHPAAQKIAAEFGVEIFIDDAGAIRVRNTETGEISEDVFDKVAEVTETLRSEEGVDSIEWQEIEDEDAEEADEDAEEGGEGRSGVMSINYHREYSKNPDGPGCNDNLDIALRDAIEEYDAEGNTLGSMSRTKLVAIGLACGLWREEWDLLNNGMARMNLSNRMRGWLRNNDGTIDLLNGVAGRFGVARKVPKEEVKAPKTKKPEQATVAAAKRLLREARASK